MRFGILPMPLGLLEIAVIIVLVMIIANALGKSRGAGRVLAAGCVTVAILAVLLVGFAGLTYKGAQRVDTIDQAKLQVEQAQKHREEIAADMREQTNSRIEDIELIPTPVEPGDSDRPGMTIAGTPWSNAVEEFQDFEADVYPSIESAAEALGRRVGLRLIEATTTGDRDTRSIYVWRDKESGDVTRDVLEAVASGLRQKLDEPGYVSVERPASKDAVAVRVAIQEIHFENHKRWGRKTESRSGGIALRVKVPGGPFSVSTRFNEMPWVVDRSTFATKFSKGDWLVGFSDGTHTTHEEARRDALAVASNALLPLAQARISHFPASDRRHYIRQLNKNAGWLLERIADELVSRNLVKDRFTQSFERPYGTVWREAVLVDASPKRVGAITDSLMKGVDSRVAHNRTTWFSFFGLGGLVFGTYLFLNMATKGYYTWALRLAAVAGLGAVVFAVTHLL